MNALILHGVEVPIDAHVLTWKHSGGFNGYGRFGYVPKSEQNRERRITLGVLHATVNNSIEATWRALAYHKRRNGTPQPLGVHFGIAKNGTIYQFLDVQEIAFHATGVNSIAWGVEIVNPFDIKPGANDPDRPDVPVGVTAAGNTRRLVEGYTPEQVASVIALAEVVHQHEGIPRVLPAPVTDKREIAGVSAGYEERVRAGAFKGLSGHYHSSPPTPQVHVDPGTDPWPAFVAAGWKAAA